MTERSYAHERNTPVMRRTLFETSEDRPLESLYWSQMILKAHSISLAPKIEIKLTVF